MDENENPYEPPKGDSTTESPSIAELGERIPFDGVVSQLTVLTSLRPRFSWSGLGTLGVGTLVCLASAPPSFLNPFNRPGMLYVDLLSEQLGLMGLGTLLISLWHIYSAISGRSVLRRERFLVSQSPSMYSVRRSGWVGDEGVYFCEGETQSWISWFGVGHHQRGEEILLIDWGPGVGGTSVLTEDLFSSSESFLKAATMFAQRTRQDLNYNHLADLNDYLEMDGLPMADPTEVVAELNQSTSHREAWQTICRKIPESILTNGRPLHIFFGIMLLLALVFVQRWWISWGGIVILWGGIMLLGMLISYYQIAGLRRRGDQRMIVSKTQFTREAVHVHSTVAYSKLPIDGFKVVDAKQAARVGFRDEGSTRGEKLLLTHRDSSVVTPLNRSEFRSNEEWLAVCEIFQR